MTATRLDTRAGLLLILPAFFALGVFNYYPILQTTLYSFFDLDTTTDWLSSAFVGLKNYRHVMSSGAFWYTFGFTLFFTCAVVLLDLVLGMGLALATFVVAPSVRGILRAIIIVPWAVPQVIQASMWRWMLNSEVGPVGDLLVRGGLVERPPLFLVHPALAVASLVVVFSWKGSAIAAFFFMGALAMIPRDILEAATIDGARRWRRFLSVTLPMVIPTVFVALLYRTQDALRVFDVVYGLTGGGPGTTTDTMSSFAYKTYFRYAQFGHASAYAIVTYILVVVVGVYYISRIHSSFNFRD
jgi:multiple sugar transport system permease protein